MSWLDLALIGSKGLCPRTGNPAYLSMAARAQMDEQCSGAHGCRGSHAEQKAPSSMSVCGHPNRAGASQKQRRRPPPHDASKPERAAPGAAPAPEQRSGELRLLELPGQRPSQPPCRRPTTLPRFAPPPPPGQRKLRGRVSGSVRAGRSGSRRRRRRRSRSRSPVQPRRLRQRRRNRCGSAARRGRRRHRAAATIIRRIALLWSRTGRLERASA